MKRRRTDNKSTNYAIFGDIKFPRANPLADYDTRWNTNFNDRTLITVHVKDRLHQNLHYAPDLNAIRKTPQAIAPNDLILSNRHGVFDVARDECHYCLALCSQNLILNPVNY